MKPLTFALGLCAVATLVAAQAAAKGGKRRTAAPVEKVELGVLGLLTVGGDDDAVAVDATNVYWTSAVGEVFKQEKTSDAAVKLATFQIDAYQLALDGSSLYWAAGGGGAIAKLALAGGEPSTLADQQTFASALAVDGGRVYWARRMTLSGKGGSILSVPLAGGEPTTLAAGQAEPVALAVGPKEIYWANRGDGTIHKARK